MKRMLYPLAFLGLAGCASLPIENPFKQREYSVSELRVDPGASRTYVGQEDEAIRRMMDQAVSSPDEDAWMEIQEPNRGAYFVDIGKDAGTFMLQFRDSKTNEVVVEIPQKRIENDTKKVWSTISNLPSGTKVRFYHIHPLGDDDENTYLEKELPSHTDFLADIQIRIIGRQYRPDVEILPSRVAGMRGYSEFSTSEEDLGIPRIETLDQKAIGDLEWTIGTRHMTSALKFANKPPATMDQVIEDLNKNGLKIEYRRLRDTPESLKIKRKALNTR